MESSSSGSGRRPAVQARYQTMVLPKRTRGFPLATALRESLSERMTLARLRADILAGLVVGVVALPLSMALAIASGVSPQHGIYTAIVAGGLTAVLGGSRVNITGPTAAFVVVLAPVSEKFGLGGLALASAMAGILLIIMGLCKLGRLISYIPHPVTTGFTAGIAVTIATLQLRDFFGLSIEGSLGEHYWDKVATIFKAMPTLATPDFLFGITTLALLLLWPRITKKIPGPLVGLGLAGVAAWLLPQLVEGFSVATIGSRFSATNGIPQVLPSFVFPWNLPNASGEALGLNFSTLTVLMQPALAIAMLGAIESLLCAVVADGMTGFKHDPDVELTAQGIGNLAAPFLGGFAATGAIARTATGIRAGGRSPITGLTHAVFVLVAVLALAPLLAWLPMASMAALLLVVAWNMSEAKHFIHTVRVAPASDVVVLLTCFGLTVIFDMVIAVGVGMVLAAFLFMRRMVEISNVHLGEGYHPSLKEPLPPEVVFYDIAGPLFFGAAQKAIGALADVGSRAKVMILHMGAVPVMDMTGLVALETGVRKLHARGVFVIIAGVQEQPSEVIAKGGLTQDAGNLAVCRSLEDAIGLAKQHLATNLKPTRQSEVVRPT